MDKDDGGHAEWVLINVGAVVAGLVLAIVGLAVGSATERNLTLGLGGAALVLFPLLSLLAVYVVLMVSVIAVELGREVIQALTTMRNRRRN